MKLPKRHSALRSTSNLLATTAIVAAGLASGGHAAAAPGGAGHGAHLRFAWLANDPGNTYDNATLAGIRDVAAKSHSTVDPFYAGFDPDTQLAQCFAALDSGSYDGIFIEAASGTGIEPCVAEAHQAGIPVVATDLPIGPDADTVTPQVLGEVGACFIPAHDFGDALLTAVPEGCQGLDPCNVLYVAGDESFLFDQDGLASVAEVASTTPSVHLVGDVQAFYDTPTARALVAEALAAHPEINFVVASGDQMALGAEQAAADAGVTLGILGGGAGESAIEAVREGRWFGTFNALPRTEGHIGAEMMVRAVRDRNTRPSGVDPIVASGLPAVWTQATLAQYPSFVPEWPGP